MTMLSTYYASLMALILSYLIDSFKSPLPWTDCRPDWPNCVASSASNTTTLARTDERTSILTNYTTSTTGFLGAIDRSLVNLSAALHKRGKDKAMGSSEFYFM